MDFSSLCLHCRSYRRFKQVPVPKSVIDELMRNVSLVSCSRNAQKLRYYVISSDDVLRKVFPCLHWAASLPKEIGTPKEGETPTLLIVVCKQGNYPAETDAGIAVRNLALNAYVHGVGSCVIGNVNFVKLKEILEIPDNLTPLLTLALGYPSHTSTVVDVKDNSLKYYVDKDGNYFVPKLKPEDICKFR